MININLILGNIFKETSLESTNFEKLAISRIDLEKRILRKKTDLGTDIGINLDSGIKLQHGDIIGNNETKIIVEQIPEKVISVKLKENKVPVQWLDDKWHYFLYIQGFIPKETILCHTINKDFDLVWRRLNA